MPLTGQKVLTRPPKYLGFLEETRWDNERDAEVANWRQQNNVNIMRGYQAIAIADEHMIAHMFGALYIRVFMPHYGVNPDEVQQLADKLAHRHAFMGKGNWWNAECQEAMAPLANSRYYGLASLRVVTTVGVNFLTDAFQGTVNLSIMRFHGIGSGVTAEATADTALVTEFTTQLTPASTRATGTLTEGASANIFRTVGSNQVNSTVTAAEHGIFSLTGTGTGVLLDRSQFAGVGLVNGNTFQTTYDLTTAAGG